MDNDWRVVDRIGEDIEIADVSEQGQELGRGRGNSVIRPQGVLDVVHFASIWNIFMSTAFIQT